MRILHTEFSQGEFSYPSRHDGRVVKATDLNIAALEATRSISVGFARVGSNPARVARLYSTRECLFAFSKPYESLLLDIDHKEVIVVRTSLASMIRYIVEFLFAFRSHLSLSIAGSTKVQWVCI